MKRVTRRQAQSWLLPMRRCFNEMKTGLVDSIGGYAVTRLHHNDEYARVDYCIAGFRGLLQRLLPDFETTPMLKIEKKLAHGAPVTMDEIDDVLRLLNARENALIKFTVAQLKAAVTTEQISIELETLGIKQAA